MSDERRTEDPAIEDLLAPAVDPQWAEDLIIELRLGGMPGDQIGAALAEVNDQVLTSGRPALEGFVFNRSGPRVPVRESRFLDFGATLFRFRCGLSDPVAP